VTTEVLPVRQAAKASRRLGRARLLPVAPWSTSMRSASTQGRRGPDQLVQQRAQIGQQLTHRHRLSTGRARLCEDHDQSPEASKLTGDLIVALDY